MTNPSVVIARTWQRAQYGSQVKTHGNETHSPCPLCNAGTDRFRITDKGTGEAGLFCRVCGPDVDGLKEICRMIDGGEFSTTKEEYTPPKPTPIADRKRMESAWKSATPIDDDPTHPANQWAASFGATYAWPTNMRWIEGQPTGWDCCGRILVQYGNGTCTGIQQIPVNEDGSRGEAWGKTPEERARRKYPFIKGSKVSGGYATVRAGTEHKRICVVEGVKDGIALSHILTDKGLTDRVIALGAARAGKGDAEAIIAAANGAEIVICFDNDNAGQTNAHKLARAVNGFITAPPEGKDWADYLSGGNDTDDVDMEGEKPVGDNPRQALLDIPGNDMEGLRQISEAWAIQWRYNIRTRHAEIAFDDNEYAQVMPVVRNRLMQDIRTRCTMPENKSGNRRPIIITGKSYFDEVTTALSSEYSVDPVIEAIKEIVEKEGGWDGIERLEYTLDEFFEAGTGELEQWASRYLYVGVIQRAMEPGCVLQEIPILFGPQDVGKSILLQTIVPETGDPQKWVKEGLQFDPDPKKMYYQTKRSAIVEWAELKNLRGANIETLKSWLTTTVDIIDEKYEDALEYPRRFIIVGNANPDNAYLPNDPGGNRRFVVVNCPERVPNAIQNLKEVNAQKWCEAWEKYHREGLRANLTPNLKKLQAERNEEYRFADTIEVAVQKFVDGREGFTVEDVAYEAEIIDVDKQLDLSLAMRIGKAILNCGFDKKRNTIKGERTYRYYPKQ